MSNPGAYVDEAGSAGDDRSEEALEAAVYPAAPAAPERTLVDVFRATVAAHPGASAIEDGQGVLDYRALATEADRLAGRLRDAGVGSGDRIGVRVPSGTADLYVAILAVLTAGAAYVPVDVDDPDDRAEVVWSQAGVCAVLGAGRELTPRPGVLPRGEAGPPAPGDDAWIIFTSGSTGLPKGVAVSHRSAAAFVDAEARLFVRDRPLGPGDRVLAGLSVAFDASCEEMWLAWRHGACLIPAARELVRSGADLGGWLADRGVTVVSTVPTLAALWPADALARVRLLILGGEACPQELARRLADGSREVWNTYGPTETTVVACAAQMTGLGPVRIGLPLDGWQLAVVGKTGEPVGWGEVGELVIGGVGLGRYLDPAREAGRFTPMPALGWARAYRSGDLVRAHRSGLVFVGRADAQVKLAGRRVELGEIDAALQRLPGVAAATAAVRRTDAGAQILVGYVVPASGEAFDPAAARGALLERLPAALVPMIALVDGLPTRTSGKVDRDALPWPLPVAETAANASGGDLDGTAAWLAEQWTSLLGVPADLRADFFALGGTSLTAAQLVTELRRRYPAVSVSDVYLNPTLAELAGRLDRLGEDGTSSRRVRLPSRWSAIARSLILVVLLTLIGWRWLVSVAAVNNLVGPHRWAPHTSWWLIIGAGAVLLSPPGRIGTTVAGSRLLLAGLRPGTYPRGGSVHLRLWTAERLAAACGVAALAGTPWVRRYARALGCRVGRDVGLHAAPPVTGMAELGDGSTVEPEADLAGWWLDGDRLQIGTVRVGPGASVGTRSTLLPGADIGAHAEIAPGSCVTGPVPAGQRWTGSPARYTGRAGKDWPSYRTGRARHSRRWAAAYSLALFGLGALPLLAALPGLFMVDQWVSEDTTLPGALGEALLAAPVAIGSWLIAYAALVAILVRITGRPLRAGLHPDDGHVAFLAWLTHRLMAGARTWLFPFYASLITPAWLRCLGAKVGSRVEASTVLAIPRLTRVQDQSFLADDALLAPYELRGGWIRLGRAEVGKRAFVGNSGMVAPGRTVPDEALIAVLGDTPQGALPGSSWLGRPALELPRKPRAGDPGRTFDPPRRLVVARAAVEACRFVPLMLSLILADLVIAVLDEVDIELGVLATAAVSGLVLLLAGVIACMAATAAKWVLVGRHRRARHPLWSTFVWRNELADTFIESLAVPWLAGTALGTPLLTAWLRSLGAHIGKGVWCETWWLPEPDLIHLGQGTSVNRGCVVQTHLFHDRIMQLDEVRLGQGSTLGPHSIILPGSTLEQGTTVGAASLIMRGETVPAGTRWLGNPIAAWTAGP